MNSGTGPKFKEEEALIARQLLVACFSLYSREVSSLSPSDSSSGEGSNSATTTLNLMHRFNDRYIRRTIIDFGRCFISGSVAGFSLRQRNSLISAERLKRGLLKASYCPHNVSAICSTCVSELHSTARSVEEELFSATRIVRSICDASMMDSVSPLR